MIGADPLARILRVPDLSQLIHDCVAIAARWNVRRSRSSQTGACVIGADVPPEFDDVVALLHVDLCVNVGAGHSIEESRNDRCAALGCFTGVELVRQFDGIFAFFLGCVASLEAFLHLHDTKVDWRLLRVEGQTA